MFDGQHDRKTPSVPGLERGLAVLETIARSRNGLTFSALVRRLDIPKSSVHCLVLTLERLGYLQRIEEDGRYVCGHRLLEVADLALNRIAVARKAAPVLHALMSATGMTVHMAVLDHGDATLVARIAPLGIPPVATWLGKRLDLHCTSLGKCLIAWLPELEAEALVKARGMLRHNENTIVSVRRLKEDLARTRDRGYAIDEEEEELGNRCFGAPVFDSGGQVIAAVSLSGAVEDFSGANAERLAKLVRDAAAEISRGLMRSQAATESV